MPRGLSLYLAALSLALAACLGPQTTPDASAPPGVTTPVPPAVTPSVTPPVTTPLTETTEAATPTSAVEPPTTSVPVPATVPVSVTDCDDPPSGWDVFCESYQIILDQYVDDVADTVLAEGAARGVLELGTSAAAGTSGDLTCAIPTEAFEVLCDTLAEVHADAPAELTDHVGAAIRGMLAFGLEDPHSSYLTPDAVERARADGSGRVEGIGALVSIGDPTDPDRTCTLLTEGCRMVIAGTIQDSPAARAGLRKGDAIVAVDGDSVEGWTVDEVVARVRGPAGTSVTLTILRSEETFKVTIVRAEVAVPVVESQLLDPGLGYVRLSFFASNSPSELRGALTDLLDRGATQLIFDLSDNPGGGLDAAVGVASEFLADGFVLRTQSPSESTEYRVRSGGAATDPGLDLVVLMNGASASASEVVAAALQEAGRATIIGETSFGKNTVQREYGLDNGGALRLTIARWVTPNGVDFGGVGITPDIAVADTEEDRLLAAARDYLART